MLLTATFFVPGLGFAYIPEYLAVTAAISVLGGITIGQRWAVYLALATLGILSVLLVLALHFLFRVRPGSTPHPWKAVWILLGQTLIGATATALGVSASSRFPWVAREP